MITEVPLIVDAIYRSAARGAMGDGDGRATRLLIHSAIGRRRSGADWLSDAAAVLAGREALVAAQCPRKLSRRRASPWRAVSR